MEELNKEKLKNIRGAIFDLDGTLFDSMGIWEQIDFDFFAARNIPMPPDYLEAVTPLGFAAAAEYTKARFHLSDTPEELMREWHERSVYAYAHTVTLKPYAKEFLTALKAHGVKLATATALDEELFFPALKNNRILSLFDAFVSIGEVSRGKGFPDIYCRAAEKLQLPPSDCAVFEDIYLGVKGANDGGFFSVGVYDRYSNYETEQIKRAADLYLHSFEELKAQLNF